ncbi:MAG: hypothetical protein AB8B74_05330 [Crocinitomicaceae bacterium]
MKKKYWFIACFAFMMASCSSNRVDNDNKITNKIDTIQLAIEDIVTTILNQSDSLTMIPSLRYAKGETETYMVKMFGKDQTTKRIREEHISNDFIIGRDYFYEKNELVFIKEEGSVFDTNSEIYTEKLIYIRSNQVYAAYKKHTYAETQMFSDSLFKLTELDLSDFDLEKPRRALNQKGEFAMHFDEFLFIEPQTYLIVENMDQTMNAALYIIESDSLLDSMYANPTLFKNKKLWVYHSFLEMSGIERMIYEGAVLLPTK